MAEGPTIVLAGGAGDLGFRIGKALKARGVDVRALVRPDAKRGERARLEAIGLVLAEADPLDRDATARACAGAECVVSALNGLRDVIVERQTVLLDAAVEAGAPRFISSDYSLDFTRTEPGGNRNLDLRREFMGRADRAPIRVTTILNGGFMELLGGGMPTIRPAVGRVLHWGDADQPLDFTTKDDTAAFTAAAALDADAPRVLRIAGDTVSSRGIAEAMTKVTGKRFRTLRMGGMRGLSALIGVAKRFASADAVFPAFQGMQYMRDMMSGRGRLRPLDNDRYPGLSWTKVPELLARSRTG